MAPFSLDAAQLTGTNLSGLESEIVTANAGEPNLVGGFNYSQTIRLRNQSITIDGVVASQNFDLSVDDGSITVGPAGRIIATTAQAGGIDTTLATQNGATILSSPGSLGGSIALAATGSVSLQAGSVLSVGRPGCGRRRRRWRHLARRRIGNGHGRHGNDQSGRLCLDRLGRGARTCERCKRQPRLMAA